eukprot:10137363-Ditylum_brightwellii.AAC.1
MRISKGDVNTFIIENNTFKKEAVVLPLTTTAFCTRKVSIANFRVTSARPYTDHGTTQIP